MWKKWSSTEMLCLQETALQYFNCVAFQCIDNLKAKVKSLAFKESAFKEQNNIMEVNFLP